MLSAKVIRKVQTNWPRVMRDATDNFLIEAGIDVVNQVKALTPRDSGRLQGSITYRVDNGKGNSVENPATSRDGVSTPKGKDSVAVGTNVEYATHVEYGTSHMAAQSYLRTGLDYRRKYLPLIYRDNLREAFKRGRQS